MQPLRFCHQILGVLLLSVLPFFAQAAYPVLHYSLDSGSRLEVHFNESEGAPPIQILLFGPQSSNPIVLSINDKDWTRDLLPPKQKYIFPEPDNFNFAIHKNVPSWVKFSLTDSSSYNLRQGMLIIGDQQDHKYSFGFLHVFPLEHILKHPEDKTAYHIRELPRTEGSIERAYSLAIVEDDPSSAKSEASLLMSIRDADKLRFHSVGTMAVTKAGQMQLQTSRWTDFSRLDKNFQFDSPASYAGNTYKTILLNGEPWGRPVKFGDGSPWTQAPRGPSPEEVRSLRQLEHSRQQEASLDAYESQIQQESNLTQTLLKLTGIDTELANSELMVMSYNLRALEHPIQSRPYFVLTALVRDRTKKKVTARSWVVSLNFKADAVEKYPLPKDYTIDDLYQLESGQIILKNGKSLDLSPKLPAHLSCLKAHPSKK